MKFQNPQFLFALLTLSIPIIIHLFNFRRFTTVFFTNVRLLKDVKKETQSRRTLRQLLVLLSRLLALSALVLAFARPYIPSGQQASTENKIVSIYIDNSFSMDATDKERPLLEIARQHALKIINAYKQNDQFHLLTNDFEGRHQRIVSKEEAIDLIEEIQASPVAKEISKVLSRQKESLSKSANEKVAYLLSDFQEGITDLGELENDTTIQVRLVPIESKNKSNVYIDSCWFESPVRQLNKAEELVVRVYNHSDKIKENIPVKLIINQEQKALASVDLEPNTYRDIPLSFTTNEAGFHKAVVKLEDYPVTFDDSYYFSFDIARKRAVLNIYNQTPDKAISVVYEDPYFELKHTSQEHVDYSSFGYYDLIILDGLDNIASGLSQELKKFTESGGTLLIFPSQTIDLPGYKNFLRSLKVNYPETLRNSPGNVRKITVDAPIFKNVFKKIPENIDLPQVQSYYPISRLSQTYEVRLLELDNGDSFLSHYRFGRGNIYLAAVSLNKEQSNFSQHALFVPIMYNIALFSKFQRALSYTIGEDEMVELEEQEEENKSDLPYHITSTDFDMIPEQKTSNNTTYLFPENQIPESGHYTIGNNNKTNGILSFNYNRKESQLSTLSKKDLQALTQQYALEHVSIVDASVKNLSDAINRIDQGKMLWKFFILMALIFLAAEVILVRL